MNPKLLMKALTENQLSLDELKLEQLGQYLTLIDKWNRVFNLTAITDMREMVYLHLIDSLLISPYLQGSRLLDVGSGAGLPGLPLAIMHPQQQWTVMDKNNKKTRFMTQAVAELALKNVEVVHARAEEFHPEQGFDTIVSRAFGSLRLFAESTAHLLAANGMLLAMKGRYPSDELNDLPEYVRVDDIVRLTMAGMDAERHVIRLRKI